jgi:Legionella pneumophila major outer membrane protein precursor
MRRIGKLALAMMAWALLYQPSFGQYGYPVYGYNGYQGYPQTMQPMAYPQYPYQAPQGYPGYGQPQMQMQMQPAYRPQPVYTMQPVATPYGYQVYRPAVQQATAPAEPATVPASVPTAPAPSQFVPPVVDATLPTQQPTGQLRPEPLAAQVAQPMPAAPAASPPGGQPAGPGEAEPEPVAAMPTPAPMAAPPVVVQEEAPLIYDPAGNSRQPKDPRRIGDHETGMFGDFLYLRARNSDLVYGQPRNGIGVLGVPAGGQGILEPEYAAGFRVGGDFALSRCGSIEASFLWWQNQAHDTIVAPPNTVIQSAITLPQTLNAAGDSLMADGNYSFDLKVGDLVYKHILCTDNCHYAVNWLAGVRYAHLEENFHGDFSIIGATTVDTNITFDGAGPRVGLEGELVGKCGLMVFGRSSASLLAGHFGGNFIQQNVFAGVQGNTDYRNDRIVPILELELGVGWVSPGGCIRISGGYYVSAWLNAVTTPDFIQSVQNNNFTTNSNNLSDVLTFDGVMARLEFRY